MELYKTEPIYTIKLSDREIKKLSVDLHRWYVCASVDENHALEISDELAEGECEFGLSFICELEKLINDTRN